MRHYSYNFLKEEYLPPTILRYVSNIEAARGRVDVKRGKYEAAFAQMESIARVQSIRSSNAIEGIVTTDERIRSIINGETAPAGHSEQEILGYRNNLDLIHSHYDEIQIEEESILELHARLLELAMVPDAGEYKRENNVITEEMTDGRRTVRWTPPAAEDTPAHMEQLVLAYKEAISDPAINRLMMIPCFILDFLCIHPFQDGNGRMSRLLTLLLLYKNGYYAGRYISMEQAINDTRADYYLALQKSSDRWDENRNDYYPFIEYCLRLLSECYTELNSRFVIVDGHKQGKSDRVSSLITGSPVAMSKQEICSHLPDVSQTTVELTLNRLVKENIIRKVGQGRATKYIRN